MTLRSNSVAMLCVKYFKHNNIELAVRINECYFYFMYLRIRVAYLSGDTSRAAAFVMIGL